MKTINMELFDSLSLFDVQGPHSAQQIEGDEMVHNTGVSPIRQAPNSESIDRSRASHDQLQYNKELINADGSVACPVCVPQAPCGGCGIIVGDHDLCDCEYQTDRDDVAQPIKPFGRHHHDGLRRTTHSVHGKLNSANCGAKCRYDHGIMPDEYHSENNAAISKELEVLKQMMIVFAGLHFIPWLNNIGSGNNIAEPTPEKIAEAIKSLSAETSKIYEDHIVGRHSGAHCKPTVLAALLGNRRFAHDMVIGILGNVLVEQVLGHTWFGWDLSNGSYEPMHKDTFDSEGARDDGMYIDEPVIMFLSLTYIHRLSREAR